MLLRSLLHVATADVGVRADHVLTAFVDLPTARYPRAADRLALLDRLQPRIAAIPGVEAVAAADRLPAQAAGQAAYELAGTPPVDAQARPRVSTVAVGPGYFRTLGAPPIAGREFAAGDGPSAPPVAVVNQRFAAIAWPGADALGKRLRLAIRGAPDTWLTVVGVGRDIVQSDVTRQSFEPIVYVSLRQQPASGLWLLARTGVPPEAIAPALRAAVQAVDPDLPLFEAMPLADRLVDGYRAAGRFSTVFAAFAAVALALAAIGLYAATARLVSQRVREIGVRMAIGATPGAILALVVRQTSASIGCGLALGLAGAIAVTPLLRSTLVGVSPADPLSLALAAAMLVVAACLGCLIPMRRAMRVEPVEALRQE